MDETKRLTHNKGTLEVLHFDHSRAEYTNVPAYLVFDEKYRKSGLHGAMSAMRQSTRSTTGATITAQR